jgi:D-threo-aldose 1-dehydrogenase
MDPDGIGELEPVNTWTRDDVHRSIEESLKRLNLDSVDIIYVHDPDVEDYGEDQAVNEAFPALIELREQGVIKAIGCGMNEWQMPLKFIQQFDLDIILLAGRYTLLDHSGLEEFLPACVERDVKITVGGPYNSGILARDLSQPVTFNYEQAPRNLVEQARRLTEICVAHGVDLKAAALQFVLAHPAVATAVPGAQSIAELEQNIAMVQQEIPGALWSDMRSAGLIPDNAPTPD